MFERPGSETPFIGPSQRLTPPIPTRATFQHPVARSTVRNDDSKFANPPHANRPYRPNSENLNRPYQDNEPATPQPVANAATVPALRGAMYCNVAPAGWEGTVKKMKQEPGIDNPFALAWWMKGQGAHPHK